MVAFSGGPDSVCLLHQLTRTELAPRLHAVHVDHGLDHGSAERASRALAMASAMGVKCTLEAVRIRRSGSIEANAREARYAALKGHLGPDDILVTAHHADDVAETVMLRLLRGAGPAGLSGIPEQRRFGSGWLLRPLLAWRRQQILDYLREHALDCIHDPANELLAMDRNFIRHEVMPLLVSRFPGAVNGLLRSARLNRGASASLMALSLDDLESTRLDRQRLDLARLQALDGYRRSETLRQWCLDSGHEPPPGLMLDEFMQQLASADADRLPELRWGDVVLRRYAGAIWLESEAHWDRPEWNISWDGTRPLDLPQPAGTLALQGLLEPQELSVRAAGPGERIVRCGHAEHARVKKLMNQFAIPPWQRAYWPRLWLGDKLVAVGDLWVDQDFDQQCRDTGVRLLWQTSLFRPTPAERS